MNQATLDLYERAVEQLLREMDRVDEALGAHLLAYLNASGIVRGRECRAAVLRWCASPATRAAHSAEVLDATAHALEVMDGESIEFLIQGMMEEKRNRPPSAA